MVLLSCYKKKWYYDFYLQQDDVIILILDWDFNYVKDYQIIKQIEDNKDRNKD